MCFASTSLGVTGSVKGQEICFNAGLGRIAGMVDEQSGGLRGGSGQKTGDFLRKCVDSESCRS